MNPMFLMCFLSLGVFLGMLLFLYAGFRIGRKTVLKEKENWGEGLVSIHGALFALLGLLIAFTFTGAYDRYDHRRQLIVEEANNIGTAYLRLDLLPAKEQTVLKDKFVSYINSRIAFYEKLTDRNEAHNELLREKQLQNEIWKLSVEATNGPDESSARKILLPALNQMFDISLTRKNAILTHAPFSIIAALVALSYTCAFLAGIGMAKSSAINWLHALLFSGIIAFFIFLILDIEYPRYGFVRLDKANELLTEVRNGMQRQESVKPQ